MKYALIALVIALAGRPATDEQIGDTLNAAGLTNYRDEGAALFGCSRDEVGSKFTATNTQGRAVSGYVCCGGYTPLTKGCTIRY